MSKRRVVVTGLGTINALAHNVDEFWENLLQGESGIALVKHFELGEEYNSRIAGEVRHFAPEEYFEKKRLKKLDRYTKFALWAAKEAMEDACLSEGSYDPERSGCILCTGIGGMYTYETECAKHYQVGARRVSPFFIPKMIANAGAAEVAIENNLKGINFNISSACASANHGIGTAYRSIQYGDADLIVCGGAEAAVTPLTFAGFGNMKALSTRNESPETACRPFDAERDGFILAEGAGVVILEELEHALSRGAHIYAELVGYGATCDAYHITAPAEGGEGGARAMQMAIKDAGMQPEDIEYINAHGTSTPLNDVNEAKSIKTVFGEYAYKLKINSTKSMVGHTLGAAAGIEAVVCCKSIQTGKLHATMNLTNPDPECDLDFIANTAEDFPVRVAMSNSLGFGGHNGVLIFCRYDR
ncbi:MAG: beta-ketoacyl-ACP synthase II [Candidatus Cloacimonetes bacterium]|nr:beta-ketoacyl-ACP synthase II [Candidatus Cloacimonadota bacterium]